MADGISIREFARREGVSDALVRRAVKQNRLKALADGSIDPGLVGSAWRKGNATGANSSANTANTSANSTQGVRSSVRSKPEGSSQASTKAVTPTKVQGEEESAAETAERILRSSGAPYDYAEALRVKENYLALLRQLEYERKSGALVELALAQQVLFEEFRAQRDAWLNFPVAIGPLLAAELGLEADRVVEALTAHVHKQIADLGEPDGDFESRED